MNSNNLLVFLGAAVILIILLSFFIKKKKSNGVKDNEVKKDGPWPFYAKKILTQPEQILYYRLVEALPDYIVLAQVQLSRALGVKKGFNFNEWQNRINRMSLDFVICNKDSSIIAAIELDDKTHEGEIQRERDAKKDKALQTANIKIIRWTTKNIPNVEEIKKILIQ